MKVLVMEKFWDFFACFPIIKTIIKVQAFRSLGDRSLQVSMKTYFVYIVCGVCTVQYSIRLCLEKRPRFFFYRCCNLSVGHHLIEFGYYSEIK